jgi:ABC-type multidrug transport system ATPase subunit
MLYDGENGVRDLRFEAKGGLWGLIGANGSGKTTAMKLLTGLLVPDSGKVLMNGIEVGDAKRMKEAKRSYGYAPSEKYLFAHMSGRQNLEYLSLIKTGDKKAYRALEGPIESFGLREFWDRPFGDYSMGMAAKTQIVASLIGDPGIIVWDEPNDGIDILSNIALKALMRDLRSKGKLLLVSTHVADFLDGLLDGLVVLDKGRVAAVLENPSRSIEDIYMDAIMPRIPLAGAEKGP